MAAPKAPPRGCRWCGKPDPVMRGGLCRGCERKRVEDAGQERALEIADRPKPPPVDLFAEPVPPPDLFEDEPKK